MAEEKLTLAEFFKLPRSEQNIRYQDLSDHDKFGARQADISTKEVFVPCNYCRHYRGFAKCEAYPEKIPKEVMRSIIENNSYQCSDKYHFEHMGHKW